MDSLTNSNTTVSLDLDKPSSFLRSILVDTPRKRKRSIIVRTVPASSEMENYDVESVRAIRSNDISTLRDLHKSGKSFDACNSNGETLLHLACRRSNIDTVRFLVHEACVKVDVQDSMGRTVLHDCCWRPKPDLEMMEALIQVISPDMLLVADIRGHTCFDYCRKNDWSEWMNFLRQSTPLIKRRAALVQSVSGGLE